MRMPTLTCSRCGKEDTMMVDAPRLDDQRVYCIECYAILFPPGWTDEYQPVSEIQSQPQRTCNVFKYGHCSQCDHPCAEYLENHGWQDSFR